MPEISTVLSQRQSEVIKKYADENGMTEEQAIGRLAMDGITSRLKLRMKRGEVRAFKSPKSC
jgi:hypothetical protein